MKTTVSLTIAAGLVLVAGSWAQTTADNVRAAQTGNSAGDQQPNMVKFAAIPGGNFPMGDTLDGASDAPQHTVKVSGFFIARTQVTKEQWDEVRRWGLAHGYKNLSQGASKAANHPLQTVNWYDAVKWCNAKSEQEGLTPCYYTDAAQTSVYRTGSVNIGNTMVKWTANGYRLPTEAEWEKAARGGLTDKRFPWGDTVSHNQASYLAKPGSCSYDVSPTGGHHPDFWMGGQPYTSPVRSFAANGYGLFDMVGNVCEWCWDLYGEAYYSSSPAADPRGPDSGSKRILRGGCWASSANKVCCAARDSYLPDLADCCIGLRLARSR